MSLDPLQPKSCHGLRLCIQHFLSNIHLLTTGVKYIHIIIANMMLLQWQQYETTMYLVKYLKSQNQFLSEVIYIVRNLGTILLNLTSYRVKV